MNTTESLVEQTCLVRATHQKHGRTQAVSPGRTSARYLHYGRIILGPNDPPVHFENGTHETGLIAFKGRATVKISGKSFQLSPYDALYIPRDTAIEVRGGSEGCDLAELSAAVDGQYPLKFVPYTEVQQDSGLHFKAGGQNSGREVNILIGKNVEAGRIMAGVTFSQPGNWTSWPPHEHAAMLEEAYLYIDMPAPAWGLQFVYTNPASPELALVVHEGDCVVIPKGYHPNVAAPGGSINFLWMMAALRERDDRQFGVVNVQPEYAAMGSGIEKGRAAK